MSTTDRELSAPLQGRGMLRGLLWFLLLTGGGLAGLFALTFKGEPGRVLESLSPVFLALAALSAVMDVVIGAIRYQIFLRRIRPGTSFWLPIRADLANRFIGAVTPSQTGGGPAQVYVLHRGGIPVPDALSFLLVNFLSTLIFFLLAGGFTAWVFRGHFAGGGIRLLVFYGFVAFALCLAAMLLSLFRPDLFALPLAWLSNRLRDRRGRTARVTVRVLDGLVSGVERYRTACRRFVLEAPLLPVVSFLLTIVLYLNKFTMAWLVMRGLGVHGSYLTTVAVQALLHFILYVAPSPGGSGIAELSTGAFMALLLPANLLALFTLAYRFFLIYLPASVGAFVMMSELRPRASLARAGAPVALLLAALLLGSPHPGAAQQSSPGGTADARSLVVEGLVAPDRDQAKKIFEHAVAVARARVAASPEDAEAHYLLAVALGYLLEHQGIRTKLRMAGEVREEAERTLELDPAHAGAHHVLGRLHAGAMRLNPIARLVAREILGASVLGEVSWDHAERHFLQAWRLEPANPRHAMELGALYIDTDRPRLARVVLERAVALTPHDPSDSLVVARSKTLLADLHP